MGLTDHFLVICCVQEHFLCQCCGNSFSCFSFIEQKLNLKHIPYMKPATDSLTQQADVNLLKETTKLVHRIERILVPSSSLVYSSIGTKVSTFLNNLNQRKYFCDVTELSHSDLSKGSGKYAENVFRRVDWDLFIKDLTNIIGENDPTYVLPKEALDEIERERIDFENILSKVIKKEKIRLLQVRLFVFI